MDSKESINFDKKDSKFIGSEELEFTHHEAEESLAEAVTHQMEDDGDVDDYVRRGIDDIALKYAELGAQWQKDRDRDVYFYKGALYAKEQMKKETKEVKVKNLDSYSYNHCLTRLGLKDEDTVKLYIFPADEKKLCLSTLST